MMRSLCAGLVAATLTYFGTPYAEAQTTAPTITQTTPPTVTRAPTTVGRLTARAPDLVPIPSRIEHGVVSVRNAGSAASVPSVVTVDCHLPGEEGGCPELPAAALAAYTDAAFPNRLVVQVPAIQPGHVYNHNLTFWDGYAIPAGTYQFDYVADASATNAETNEGNNAASHTWVKP